MARTDSIPATWHLDSAWRFGAILVLMAFGLTWLPVSRTHAQGLANGSLGLDGTTGYAEAPHAAELSGVVDWTIEAWLMT